MSNPAPSFTFLESANEPDFDFNMLSEYLLVDDDPLKVPTMWTNPSSDDYKESKSSAIVSEQGRGISRLHRKYALFTLTSLHD